MSDEHPDPGELELYWHDRLPDVRKDLLWYEFILTKFNEAGLTDADKTRLERRWRESQDSQDSDEDKRCVQKDETGGIGSAPITRM